MKKCKNCDREYNITANSCSPEKLKAERNGYCQNCYNDYKNIQRLIKNLNYEDEIKELKNTIKNLIDKVNKLETIVDRLDNNRY